MCPPWGEPRGLRPSLAGRRGAPAGGRTRRRRRAARTALPGGEVDGDIPCRLIRQVHVAVFAWLPGDLAFAPVGPVGITDAVCGGHVNGDAPAAGYRAAASVGMVYGYLDLGVNQAGVPERDLVLQALWVTQGRRAVAGRPPAPVRGLLRDGHSRAPSFLAGGQWDRPAPAGRRPGPA